MNSINSGDTQICFIGSFLEDYNDEVRKYGILYRFHH